MKNALSIFVKTNTMKYICFSIILSFSFVSYSQVISVPAAEDCLELFCDNGAFIDQHIQNVNNEIAIFGEGSFCNPGTLQQCFFQGQPVYTVLESPFICDLPTRVLDCSGNSLFTFGGFCFPAPCPGQDQAGMLEGCITLYSTFETDNAFCTSEQLACTEPFCSTFEQIANDLLDPNINPSFGGCEPIQTLSQCDYRGLTVVVQSPGTCFLADEPSTVFDCTGDFLFAFGGFCVTSDGRPCPGDIEAQFISNCQVFFDVQDREPLVCDDATVIPTMGEWGLIIISLLLLIFGVLRIKIAENIHAEIDGLL